MKRRISEKSKKRILNAAREVFSEKGYSKTTIREVAKLSDISVGGIYLYYKNKEELYTELTSEQMKTFLKHTEALRNKQPLTALKSLIEGYLDYAIKWTKLVSMHIKEHDLKLKKSLKKEFLAAQRRLLSDILTNGVKKGIFRDINCNETAGVILFSLRGMILAYISGDIETPRKQGDFFYKLILNGIKRKDK